MAASVAAECRAVHCTYYSQPSSIRSVFSTTTSPHFLYITHISVPFIDLQCPIFVVFGKMIDGMLTFFFSIVGAELVCGPNPEFDFRNDRSNLFFGPEFNFGSKKPDHSGMTLMACLGVWNFISLVACSTNVIFQRYEAAFFLSLLPELGLRNDLSDLVRDPGFDFFVSSLQNLVSFPFSVKLTKITLGRS